MFEYVYEKPGTMTQQMQYFVMPALDMVGIIGGNLGIFIGFSFMDFINTILDYLKLLLIKLIGNTLK